MVLAYWLIGREIVQDLQSGDERAEYGKRVISDLSAKLTQRYGAGYSAANLWLFRQFYQVFQERQSAILNPLGRESGFAPEQILDPLGRESETSGIAPFHPQLSWSHYRAIMRVEKPHAREFYENECGVAGWTKRELERQIHSLYYDSPNHRPLLRASGKPATLRLQIPPPSPHRGRTRRRTQTRSPRDPEREGRMIWPVPYREIASPRPLTPCSARSRSANETRNAPPQSKIKNQKSSIVNPSSPHGQIVLVQFNSMGDPRKPKS
jgi:hypothetical protein